MEERFRDPEVAAKFREYSGPVRHALMMVRTMVFEIAGHTSGVGQIEECLKWGQISYLTPETRAGTTVRMAPDSKYGCDFALYVNCKSSLVGEWRDIYPELTYGDNRSVHFDLDKPLPEEKLRHMIAMALTYHKRKKGDPDPQRAGIP